MQSQNHKITSESRVTNSSGKTLENRIFYPIDTIVWARTIFWT